MGKHAFDVNSVAGKGVVLSLPNEGVHLYIPVDLKKSNDFYHDKKKGGRVGFKNTHIDTHTAIHGGGGPCWENSKRDQRRKRGR